MPARRARLLHLAVGLHATVDDLCALDGIHAGGYRADADFDAKKATRLNITVDPPLRDPRKKS